MINKVILIGNLGSEPEIRNYENETTVATLKVATNENYKDKSGEWQQITEWHRVVAWRELAKRAERQLQKGTRVYIEGKLTNRSWQTESGETRYITEVRANVIRVLAKGKESENRSTGNNYPPMEDKYGGVNTNNTTATQGGVKQIVQEDDDLPF
ncbi:MAG: single-stranded DNA-binding protein [Saprospiraceae bacterium]|nr:single-stranded DNA-binding protein [Saprospiraceae bacterium]